MITGFFTKVEIPEVRVGEDIKATIGFYALNPGAYYWATFLIVDSIGLPLVKMLDKARETGQEGGREKTYSLGRMPDRGMVAIGFFLFAHDDAGYDWDWAEYNRWKLGFSTNLTYLGSAYRFISPVTEPPPPPDVKVLKYEILGEKAGGSITFNPPALDYEGHYYKGTVVNLTAVVNPGYVFVKWRGEVDNELSTNLYNTVTMSENRLVKAEFAKVEEPDLKVLDYAILGEKAGGSITFDPPALDYEGHYRKGTVVTLRAVVNPGFRFVKWRGEVDNELSTSLTNTVTMSENRLVKAEFGLVEVEKFYPLEVDITPAAGGYVTTEPPPVDIANYFIDGTVGKFSEGTRVLVTAHPNAGYEFDHWSDEIQGGVSYNPTEWVSESMTEHKAVKAHFRLAEVPPECSIDADCPLGYVCRNGVCVPEDEIPPITCSIDADCPTGYVCQNGVCVPTKPPIPSWLIPALIAGVAVLLLVPAKKGK